MVMIALCSSLIGAVLGTRFRVQVLFPAAMLGFVIVASVAAFKGSVVSSAIVAAIVCVISLQTGFLGGLFGRYGKIPGRVPPFAAFDHRPKWSTFRFRDHAMCA